ncbi:MAG TPA: tRNA (adenosine(37)-N6)-dimethylallyltransferase MiaA [Patescibacteria group bacterium]|jgi:tRNA dimethylallyltransferase|nr:tRNA (adenosine(37)-N6)-dimethylallyltransferase MiaA [Patescibacteria group bacterium]
MKPKKSLVVIVGPTASGKSELAVELAQKMGGEIISADSRQIYKGMDIGSGKVEGKWKLVARGSAKRKVFVYKNIPHYLIDVASPRTQYSVARFKREAEKAIADILARGKQPIICGGTGHWIDALVFGQALPEVGSIHQLRAKLSKLTTTELYKKLQKLDPRRAKEIDAQNPRRLIRALEIVISTGKPVPKLKTSSKYDIKWIGLNPSKEALERKIKKRLEERLKGGMIAEVKKLRASGLSWKKLEGFGLEYKYCALFLQKKMTRQELEDQLFIAIRQYAKRQMTWWKRNHDIHWQSV